MDEFIEIIRTVMQQVQENIDEFDEQELMEIDQFLQNSFAFIEQEALREEPIGGPPTPQPELNPTAYPSSNINAFKYDPQSKKLLVKFMGKDVADSGPTYSYDQVPPFIVDVFARGAVGPKTTGKNKWHAWFKGVTPSHGAAMNALIKMGGFPYQRVA